MKELKTIAQGLFILFLSTALITSCSSDDDGNTASNPSVTYSTTTFNATFFTSGSSGAPSVNWQGNQGSFSLASPLAGLTINSTTGVLNWTKDLPLGTHNVQVVATNSNGQTTVNITINNPLQGTFTGTYGGSQFFEFEFNADGTCTLKANDELNPDLGTGTWTRTDNTIVVDYNYDDFPDFDYSLSGTLTIGANAVYSGNWYSGYGAVSGNEGGPFEMTLD